MYKLQTNLAFYKFNSTINHGGLKVTWYKLNEEGGMCEGVSFTYAELQQFQNYVSSNKINFPGENNYHQSSEEEEPYCDSIFPDENRNFPSYVILRQKPEFIQGASQYACVDIKLVDSNDSNNHKYDLPFDVIGKFEI
ncbi:MAG TPA: hypothetical protein VFJ43_10205 [Bacteroidia bacterium]|nr:hypothetical protein [Bacteroidia bacterium]